jgi:hypothetical protein
MNFNSILNIRGFKYEVNLNKFINFPSTRLGRLSNHVITNNKVEILNICDYHESNQFYFDRDPFIFSAILNFYSTGKLHIRSFECVTFIKEELDYWQIDEKLIDYCCQFNFVEKLAENKEINKQIESFKKKIKAKSFNDVKNCKNFREKVWITFEYPGSSVCAMILFIISILTVLISTFDMSKSIIY